MFYIKFQILLLLCFLNPKMARNAYVKTLNDLKMLKNINKDYSQLKVVIFTEPNPGEFNPTYGLAEEFHKLGAKVDYIFNTLYNNLNDERNKSTVEMIKKINAGYRSINSINGTFDDARHYNTKMSHLEMYLTNRNMPHSKNDIDKTWREIDFKP